MKSAIIAVLLAVVAVGAVWVFSSSTPPGAPMQNRDDLSSELNAAATAPRDVPVDIGAPDGAATMTVTHVHDGDTLFLLSAEGVEQKVRLIGIDTPELRPIVECFADEATARLRQLTPAGSTVTVQADAEPEDQYGRSLLYLWNDAGTFVNLDLVTGGYANALDIAPNSRFATEFASAEQGARASTIGYWGSC